MQFELFLEDFEQRQAGKVAQLVDALLFEALHDLDEGDVSWYRDALRIERGVIVFVGIALVRDFVEVEEVDENFEENLDKKEGRSGYHEFKNAHHSCHTSFVVSDTG